MKFDVEDIQDNRSSAIHQNDVAADDNVRAIRRWRGQAPFEFDGNGLDFFLQARGEFAANHELFLKSRRQAISLRKARREIRSPRIHPRADLVAVMVVE